MVDAHTYAEFRLSIQVIVIILFSLVLIASLVQFIMHRHKYLRRRSPLCFCYLFMGFDCLARIFSSAWSPLDSRVSGYLFIYGIAFNFTAFAFVIYTWGRVICKAKFQPHLTNYLRLFMAIYISLTYIGLTLAYFFQAAQAKYVLYTAAIVATVVAVIGFVVIGRIISRLLTSSPSSQLEYIGTGITILYKKILTTAIIQIFVLGFLVVVLLLASRFISSSAIAYISYSGYFIYTLVEWTSLVMLLVSLNRFARTTKVVVAPVVMLRSSFFNSTDRYSLEMPRVGSTVDIPLNLSVESPPPSNLSVDSPPPSPEVPLAPSRTSGSNWESAVLPSDFQPVDRHDSQRRLTRGASAEPKVVGDHRTQSNRNFAAESAHNV